MEHRSDCQLLTVPTFGLCTCDFDERMDAAGLAAMNAEMDARDRERDERRIADMRRQELMARFGEQLRRDIPTLY